MTEAQEKQALYPRPERRGFAQIGNLGKVGRARCRPCCRAGGPSRRRKGRRVSQLARHRFGKAKGTPRSAFNCTVFSISMRSKGTESWPP